MLVWDTRINSDLYDALYEINLAGNTFLDLIKYHGKSCSPLSAIVYLPQARTPECSVFDAELSRGEILTNDEGDALADLFNDNPVVKYGLFPPSDLP